MKRMTRTYPSTTREHARTLRQQGFTYTEIIAELGGEIPKNTIQSWVRDIELTTSQKARIKEKELEAQHQGQLLGAEWNREQKRQRMAAAEAWAQPIAERLVQQSDALLMMLAALWAGEGSKQDDVLTFTNSDPRIIKGWITGLKQVFQIDTTKLRCTVMISNGMPQEELEHFWSDVIMIPRTQFIKTFVDTREKKVFREGYKGTCRIVYHSAEIRRQLEFLIWAVFDRIQHFE